MSTIDLLKFVFGIILSVVVFILSREINYNKIASVEPQWRNLLKNIEEVYNANLKIKENYEKYQKLAQDYERLRQEVFPSIKESSNEVFMSIILKKLENVVTDVRNSSKDNEFKLNNINFGTISNRNIGASEGNEGIAVRSTEITMSLSGKYSTIVKFLGKLSDSEKIGSIIRVKTISFSPSSRDIGKSPVNNVNLTIEMIQIIR